MSCATEKRSVLLPTAVQRIDLVVQTADAHLHKAVVDQPMGLHLSGFALGQLVTVQTVSTPGEGVWKAQATFLTDDHGCVDIATQAPHPSGHTGRNDWLEYHRDGKVSFEGTA